MDTTTAVDQAADMEAMRLASIDTLRKQLAILTNKGHLDKLKKQQAVLFAKLDVVNTKMAEYKKLIGFEELPPLPAVVKPKLIGVGGNEAGPGRRREMPRLSIHFNDGQAYEVNPVGGKLTVAKAMLAGNDVQFAVNEKGKIIARHVSFGQIYFKSPTVNTSGFNKVTVKQY